MAIPKISFNWMTQASIVVVLGFILCISLQPVEYQDQVTNCIFQKFGWRSVSMIFVLYVGLTLFRLAFKFLEKAIDAWKPAAP